MRKFIILFVLSLSVTYAQQGWREGVRDSILIAKGKIYDSTYTRIDSILTIIPQIASSQNIDGWYYQDMYPQYTEPYIDSLLYRGFGSMDHEADITNYYTVTKIGGRLNTDPFGYVVLTLYRNDYNTGVSVTFVNDDVTYTDISPNIINVAPKDKLTLKGKFIAGEGVESSTDIKGYIELTSNVIQNISLDYTIGSYTFTALAVTQGTIKLVDSDDNESSGANPTLTGLSAGDTVWAIATPTSSWRFWCWTGSPMADNNNIENDTAYYIISGDVSIRGRFQIETPTNIVAVITDSDTTHAEGIKTSFESGYGTFTDSVHIKYYSSGQVASNFSNAYQYADSVGAHILICSVASSSLDEDTPQKYYPIQTFFVAGSNNRIAANTITSASDLPALILTGAGTDNGLNEDTCETGYAIEFWSDEFITIGSNQASYSNGFIAGTFWKYIEGNKISNPAGGINGYEYYGVRYTMRMNWDAGWTTWSIKNGYGSVSTDKWSSFNGSNYLNNTLQYFPKYFRDNDPYLKR